MTLNLNIFSRNSGHRTRPDVSKRLISALDYLQRRGLSRSQFDRLNPPAIKGRRPNLAVAKEHFKKSRNQGADVQDFAQRVIYVANLHRWNEGNFEPLIDRALEKWPLEQMAA